jgi:hypothetical protein
MHVAADGAEHWINVTAGMAGAVPSSRTGHSMCSDAQGRIVVFGGKSCDAANNSMCNDAYIADVPEGLEKTEWRQLGANAEPPPAIDPKDLPKGRKASATQPAVAVSPQPRAWHAACAVRRDDSWYMLVHGGIAADGAVLADTWLYNLTAESWVQLIPTAGASPPAAAHHTLTSLDEGRRALLLGGYDGSRHRCTAAVLTLRTQTWIVCEDSGLPPLCMHAAGAVPAVSSDCLEVGPLQAAAVAAADVSKQRLLLWGQGAVALTPAAAAASGKSSAEATLQVSPEIAPETAETVLVHGGCTTAGASAAVYALAPDCRAYVVKAVNTGAVSAARHSAAAAVIGSKLYVIGGADGCGRRLLDIAVLDTAASSSNLHNSSNSDSVHERSVTDSSTAAASLAAAHEPVRYANGDVYTGALDAAGLRNGSGEMRYADGSVYTGEWQSDLPSFGEMQYAAAPDSNSSSTTDAAAVLQCYSGAWEGGKPCGQGQGTYSISGSTFTGRWLDGLPHGPGTRDSPQGVSVEGLWELGVLVHGKETLLQQQHQHGAAAEVYEGAFRSDARHGSGRCAYADGNVYEGEWRAGRRNGQGTYTDAIKQEVYRGKWVGGVRCGRGSCAYAAGHRYEGHWLQGRRHGLGCMRYACGDVYEGEWQQGHRGGEGVLTQAAGGLVLKGAWVRDELQTALSSSVAG